MNTIIEGFFTAASTGDIPTLNAYLDRGRSIDDVDPVTGLTALHYAIGRNQLAATRFLAEKGATFGPDRQGRWPSTIAGLCEVDGELCDFVSSEEAKADNAEETHRSAGKPPFPSL